MSEGKRDRGCVGGRLSCFYVREDEERGILENSFGLLFYTDEIRDMSTY